MFDGQHKVNEGVRKLGKKIASALSHVMTRDVCFFLSLSDDCPAAWAEFEGRKGVFIEGQITPPLSGVQIVISSGGEQPISDIKVETDTNGKYRLV